jgi:hypothetical protein
VRSLQASRTVFEDCDSFGGFYAELIAAFLLKKSDIKNIPLHINILNTSICSERPLRPMFPTLAKLNTTAGNLNAIHGSLNPTLGSLNAIHGSLNPTLGILNAIHGSLNTTRGNLNAINGNLNTIQWKLNPTNENQNPIICNKQPVMSPLHITTCRANGVSEMSRSASQKSSAYCFR